MTNTTNDRAYELAFRITDVLEGEPDSSIVMATMAFVTAALCQAAADRNGTDVDDVASDHVQRILKQVWHIQDFPSVRQGGISSASAGAKNVSH